jgi:predicted transposase YdaD
VWQRFGPKYIACVQSLSIIRAMWPRAGPRQNDEVTMRKKRHDATTRKLIEMGPPHWHAYLGSPVRDPSRVKAIDSNLSTVTAECDKLLWVEDPMPWIEHIELQAGRDVGLADRVHMYNTLLHSHHKVPVRTVLVLLREAADGPELSGVLEKKWHSGEVYDWFRYHVVRVWEQPVDLLLASGLTVLPLAPVSDVTEEKLPGVLMAIADRLAREANAEEAATLWNATRILMGLRYSAEEVDSIIDGVSAMLFGIRGIEESSVYQAILKKGEAKGEAKGRVEGAVDDAKTILLRQGRKRLGPPDERISGRIAEIAELDRLHVLLDRILDVSSWDELLAS